MISYLNMMNQNQEYPSRGGACAESWNRFAEMTGTAMGYDCMREHPQRMDQKLIQELNTRLFFQSGLQRPKNETRPWQYVEMSYRGMGLTPPADVPALESMEDADIWMCLDERVNRRLREHSLAG